MLLRADVVRGLTQLVGIASDEDDVGPFGSGSPRGFQPDPRAAADQDDGLPCEFVGS